MKAFGSLNYNSLKLIGISTISSLLIVACSADSQFTKKIAAAPFVAELFGEATQTLTLEAPGCKEYAWVGLEWAADYKFFRVERVSFNGEATCQKGKGSTSVFTPLDQVADFSECASFSGIFFRDKPDQVELKVIYSPLKALESVDKPHRAYLLAACNTPKPGIVRMELNGMVKGICDPATEECNAVDISSLTAKNYELSRDGDGDGTGDLALYLCDDPLIRDARQNNDPDHEATNLAYVNIEEDFVLYVKGGGSEVHLVRSDNQSVTPSVPEFGIHVPPGTYDTVTITDSFPPLPAGLADGQDAKCDVDSNGIFECTGVEIEVAAGLVGVEPLTVTNGTALPDSPNCHSFSGGFAGSGSLSEDEITLVGWGAIESSPQVPSLVDALVVVEIPLKVVE